MLECRQIPDRTFMPITNGAILRHLRETDMKITKILLFLLLLGLLAGCSGSREAGTGQSDGNKRQKLEGREIVISTAATGTAPATGNQQNSHVIYLPDKNLWFSVYEDSSSLTTGADIKGRFIDSSGNTCGSPITITNALGNQTSPWATYRDKQSLQAPYTGLGKDTIMVVWQDARGTTTGGYVYRSAIDVDALNTTTCAGSVVPADGTAIGFNGTRAWDTPISNGTVISTGTGTVKNFSGSLFSGITAGSLDVYVDGTLAGSDNGLGSITAAGGYNATGAINYTTGAITLLFTTAPPANSDIYATYTRTSTSTQTIALGDGTTADFSSILSAPVSAGTLTVRVMQGGSAVITGNDDGNGLISKPSSTALSGMITYSTGEIRVVFATAPAAGAGIQVQYRYEPGFYDTLTTPVGDTLSSRKVPKVEFDSVRDVFWIVWTEERNNTNMASEMCFGVGPVSWSFGDATFPGYVMLKGEDYTELRNSIGIPGADIIRNGLTRTNRRIGHTYTCEQDIYKYEYFTSVNNAAGASNSSSPQFLSVWEGKRWEGTVTCTCEDLNADGCCGFGDSITAVFEDAANPTDGQVHIYGLFDQDILMTGISTRQLDASVLPAYYPSVAFDRVTQKYLAAWEDTRDGSNTKIYGQLISPVGTLYNSNLLVTFQDTDGDGEQDVNIANSKQTKPFVSYDSVNQRYFVIWEDGRNGGLQNLDVFGQYVDGEGSIRGSNYSISIAQSNQYNPTIAYNSQNNQFLAVWKDARNNATTGSDIYGQRYSLGQPQLTLLNLDNTTLSPLLINFDTVTVGQTVTRQFKIRNTGDTFLKIDCLSAPTGTNSPFSHQSLASELQTCEGTYADGTYIQLTPDSTGAGAGDYSLFVQFQPAAVGTYISAFTIQSDAEIKTVNLQGQAVGMTVSPSSISFSDTASGQYVDQTVVITNNSTDTTFSVTSISGAVAPFSIPSPPAFPASLVPGRSVAVYGTIFTHGQSAGCRHSVFRYANHINQSCGPE